MISLLLFLSWVLHEACLLLWFNIDHETAFAWTEALLSVTFTHCWGEDGFWSHLSEVAGAGLVPGAAIGSVGTLFGAVGVWRERHMLLRSVAIPALVLNLYILSPIALRLFEIRDYVNAPLPSRARSIHHELKRGP